MARGSPQSSRRINWWLRFTSPPPSLAPDAPRLDAQSGLAVDLDARSDGYELEELEHVAVPHAHTSVGSGSSDFGLVRTAVDVDVAAKCIHVAVPVAARLTSFEPQDAGQDPVAVGLGREERGCAAFSGGLPTFEDAALRIPDNLPAP